jgi:hypothetical protein
MFDYGKLTPLIVKGVQDQQGQIEDLKKGISNIIAGETQFNLLNTQSLNVSGQNLSSELSTLNSQFSTLNSRVASLEASIEKLSTLKSLPLEASVKWGSFLTPFTASSSADLYLYSIEIIDSTLTDKLSVVSYATINELSVTGNITAGLLSIKGLEDGNAAINTLNGDLKLQSDGLGGIDILDGKVSIDTEGNVTTTGEVIAKKYNVDTTDTLSASLGTIIVPSGETQITASTSALTSDSKIFATPQDSPVAISTKKTGANTFMIKIAEPQDENLRVNWWIVN